MDGDSRFGYGGESPSFRYAHRLLSGRGRILYRNWRTMDQFASKPQQSALVQPRMAAGVVNPLDLTLAIEHELRRGNTQQLSRAQGNQQLELQQQFCGSFTSVEGDSAYGYLDHATQQVIPHYIPRFDEALDPAALQQQPRFDTLPYHSSSRSANGLLSSQTAYQVLEGRARTVDSLRPCSPWIEPMMQADVTPTTSPSKQFSLSTSLRKTSVSYVLSQTVDSNDRQSRRSVFSSDQGQHESTVELSADLLTDDEELETRPMDLKREKRILSNRASAQRSRQRRQERLDHLEVLTAKLRVENSALLKKLTSVMQVARKFDVQNKDLLEKVDRLSKELEGRKAPKLSNYCGCSQQTACASSCEMVCERRAVDPNSIRGNTKNDSTTSSMPPSSPVRKAAIDSPVRKAVRKRAHEESASPLQPQPPSPSISLWLEDAPASCLESDQWLDITECFL